jgi:single-stranded-DNA-specific exonuclease
VPHPVPRIWRLLPHDRDAVERLARSLPCSPVVAQLLRNRGLDQLDDARRFLDAPLKGLHAPDLLPGVSAASERLLAAVRGGKRLRVYGDYDVDGVTGTAILLEGLRLLGADVDFYVPNRLEEGYGLNAEALRQIANEGASVVVTVDCGIASVEEAEEAKRLGLELIVTDHHEFKPTLPDAAVLVHPRLPGTTYPFDKLSGAAVAFKLAWALCQRHCGGEKVDTRCREFLLDAVALAALGIVADVVPLHDENRILVRHGLARLQQAPSPGLQALCRSAGLEEGAVLKGSDVGYKLAPRLNAAGRLGCARLVVDLLTTRSAEHARQLAIYLEDQNKKRQSMEREILRDAKEMVATLDMLDQPALVLASEEWHAGIIGIVASRLVDLYARPTLMIALRPEAEESSELIGHGSGRSVPGFPLHEALATCGDLLLSHGGHKAAAGFKVRAENIDLFRERFCAAVSQFFQGPPPPPVLTLDAEVPLAALTLKLVDDLDRLEPYGAENRKPVFLVGGLTLSGQPRRVGDGERHLSFHVDQQGVRMKAIAWSMGERLDELVACEGCCVAFTPRINEWNGRRSVELEVVDFQPQGEARLG